MTLHTVHDKDTEEYELKSRLPITLTIGLMMFAGLHLSCAPAPESARAVKDNLFDGAKRADLKWVSQALAEHPEYINLDDGAFTLLHHAAMENNVPLAEVLIHAGADVNSMTRTVGQTPLYVAARFDSADVAKILIEHGANLDFIYYTNKEWLITDLGNFPPVGWSALDIAARDGCYSTARVLLEAGANLDANSPTTSFPAILRAVQGRYPREQRSREIMTIDRKMKTTLIPLVPPGNVLVIDLLVEHGASLDPLHYPKYFPPLYLAIQNFEIESVRHLLEKHGDKFDVNARRPGTWENPLFSAITIPLIASEGGSEADRAEIIQLLLANGADPTLEYGTTKSGDRGGLNALDCAISFGLSPSIQQAIREAMKQTK